MSDNPKETPQQTEKKIKVPLLTKWRDDSDEGGGRRDLSKTGSKEQEERVTQ